MNKEFFEALDLLEKEHGISKEYMLEKIETALLTAVKKEMGDKAKCVIRIDSDKHTFKAMAQYLVVETVEDPRCEISLEDARAKSKRIGLGDIYEVEVKTKEFGRIATQAAKQVIIQGIREAQRGNMAREYESRKGEIVTATVARYDQNTGNASLVIGHNEMLLSSRDKIPDEEFTVDQKIKVFITEIKKEQRGPSVMLSRTHPDLVRKLFELEVPEIADGTVEIKAIAREAGSRTKIAVVSNVPGVDPIGSCIGQNGSRKNNVTAELAGEKIDIIKYSDDPVEFVAAALSPATVISVTRFPDDEHAYRAVVAEDQLSLAIGKKGQNARLAARLTGLKIDIKSASAAE